MATLESVLPHYSSAQSLLCFHCGLPVEAEPISENISGSERFFCCHGCRAVCLAIHDAGLQGFYSRTPENIQLAPPPTPPRDTELFDLDEMQSGLVEQNGDQYQARFLVEGIHCAACVWLIENSLPRLDGIDSARVNLTNRQLKVSWDNSKIPLSAIMRHLARIGYAAVPYDPDKAEIRLQKENRSLLYRVGIAGFGMMNLLWISIALYSGADSGEFKTLFHWIGFALATPVLIYSGYPFYSGAIRGLRAGRLSMDLPIAIGASVTWAYSVYVTLAQPAVGEVYYDTVVNFLFVILVGRYLEAIARRKAVGSTQRLLELQPRGATLIVDGDTKVVPIKAVKTGDLVLVKPGDTIPVDGEVIEGESGIDESLLTGESEPARKTIGDGVLAGTKNTWGALKIRTEKTLSQTTLGQIINLVEEAQVSRAPIQLTTDRLVPWFVAITLGLAGATFTFWYGDGVELALMSATAVLIITCPCALGLATPMAIAVASGTGARNGVLVKTGGVLEALAQIRTYLFDKTGTLTSGESQVASLRSNNSQWEAENFSEKPPSEINQMLEKIAAIEHLSGHPFARAILDFCDQYSVDFSQHQVTGFEDHPGAGIRAIIDDQPVHCGNSTWMEENRIEIDSNAESHAQRLMLSGCTPVFCSINGTLEAIIGIGHKLRDGALELINELKQRGVETIILSGDRAEVVQALADRLGGMRVIAGVRPDGKERVVRELQQQGKAVVMIGDGVNDAPALVRADVGMALGCGTDVSVDSADIVLMRDSLDRVQLISDLSRRTIRTIKQNIGISITYNLIMVPLAMATIITPLIAAVSMPISSLLVIANAARINRGFK